jgi:hypothetical protein
MEGMSGESVYRDLDAIDGARVADMSPRR